MKSALCSIQFIGFLVSAYEVQEHILLLHARFFVRKNFCKKDICTIYCILDADKTVNMYLLQTQECTMSNNAVNNKNASN